MIIAAPIATLAVVVALGCFIVAGGVVHLTEAFTVRGWGRLGHVLLAALYGFVGIRVIMDPAIAAVSLKMASYDGARVHGVTIPMAEIERVVTELARLPMADRIKVPGLEPKRADVIVAGGLIGLAYLEQVRAKEVIISDRGVRWGLAEELSNG